MKALRSWTWEGTWLVIGLLLVLVGCGMLVEERVSTPVLASATRPATTLGERSAAATATATAEITALIPVALPPPTPGPRIISVQQDSYWQGELVEFTITNPLSRTIYYTYGCGWQLPAYIQGSERLRVTITIAEGTPVTSELVPGETHTCTWDQQAYQQLDKPIPGRFRSAFELAPVPPGHYQFRLNYSFDEEEAESPAWSDIAKGFTVYSQPFTIHSADSDQ